MATTLKKDLAFVLGNVVAGALQSAKDTKAQDIAKKEAAYQALVADGSISYADQIAYRQKQLDEEKASSIPDQDWIDTITQSISQIKKLDRFAKYRAKYQSSLASLKAGTETAQQHLQILQEQYNNTTDPTLQAEIQANITDAQAALKASNDAILTNEVTRAQKDGTIPVLNQAVSDVQARRNSAVLAGNDEAVSAYDVTLTNLNSQLNQVKIQDATTKFEIQGITTKFSAPDKLDALVTQVSSADATSPVTIGGKSYASAKDYWTGILNNYIAGSGSGTFASFFNELTTTYNNQISAAVNRDGYATFATLDSIKSDFDKLRSVPALQPFMQQLNDFQSNVLGSAMQYTAKKVLDTANYTQDFKAADQALTTYGQKYGVDVSNYRMQLADDVNKQALAATGGDVAAAQKIVKDSGVTGITTPQAEFPIATKRDISQQYGLVGQTVYDKTTNTPIGSEADFAKKLGLSTPTVDWANLTLDTKYVPPTQPTATPAASAQPSTPAPTTTTPPGLQMPTNTNPAPAATTTPTPAAPAAPATPAAPTQPAQTGNQPSQPTTTEQPAKYAGSSIVDYLKSSNQDSSFTNRKKLAEQNGISNYVGSSQQNAQLLQILNK